MYSSLSVTIYFVLFPDSEIFFQYLDFTHYCKGNGCQEQLRNPAWELVQPQNNRMSFVCTLMAVEQTKEKKAAPNTTHPAQKQRQVCNSYSARSRKARFLKKREQ